MTDFKQIPIAEIAVMIAEHLQHQNIDVVLVGGLAVEIYTNNLYLTNDIDLVNINYQPAKRLSSAMAELGFTKKGRVYVNSTTDVVVEFPSAPLSVGEELIKETTFKYVGGKRIAILTAADVVKDRLAAFLHWNDNASLIQAVTVMLKHHLTPEHFKSFCEREGGNSDYQLLVDFFSRASMQTFDTMASLEPILSEILIARL